MTPAMILRRGKARADAAPLPPTAQNQHLLGVLMLVMLPLVRHLPPWVSLAFAAALLWRFAALRRSWSLPPTALRVALTLIGFAGIFASYGHISGLNAGSALLTIMTALKLTELRSRRDARVLICLMYFVLVTHFLYSQALWMAAYLLVCAWLITATLIETSHVGNLPARHSLRRSAILLLQALPLMAVMFILFPRIPGPLWGLPADSGAVRSGLGDSMAPGDIQRLILSNNIAFRVRFDGPAPARPLRYWRGPVFSFFDGRKWQPGLIDQSKTRPVLKVSGSEVSYQITLEPSRSRWLFALAMPDPEQLLPSDAQLDADAVLLSAHDNRQRRLYTLRSYPHYVLQPRLTARERRANLELPRYGDPRARALAQRWRAQGMDDRQIIAAAMRLFHTQDFRYTLNPPPLGRNTIDDFLFKTRAGFCEHYASSFTFLMRAAGIPARVVTGFQGGHRNAVGDYYVVRDSDAHAWSEVWLKSRGWVREDPTAAVDPARVDLGINAALAGTGNLPAFLDPNWRRSLSYALEARWDWVNAQWDRWFLAYGPGLQQHLMAALGLIDWGRMILALTVAITVLLGVLGLVLLRQTRVAHPEDPAYRLWSKALRKLRRKGLNPHPGEGPQDFMQRASAAAPEVARWLKRLCTAYLRARYLEPDSAQALAELKRVARQRRDS